MVTRTLVFLGVAVCMATSTVRTQGAPAAHTMVSPAELKWGPAPPVLPGAQIAVLDGDPGKPGVFTIRLRFPDGYRIPAHWHPTDENIVVMQGVFRLGQGNALSESGAHDLVAGSFAKMPKEVRHYAMAKGETIVQVYGPGPFVVNFVNPSDDPTRKQTSKP